MFKIKKVLLTSIIVFILVTILLSLPVRAANKLGELDFEQNLNDPYGYLTGGDPNIVTYVPGHIGYAARSSHNSDDGGDDLVFKVFETGGWPVSNQIYIHYYVKLESNYENCPGGGILNFKQLWTLTNENAPTGHHEIGMYSLGSNSITWIWQISESAGWDGGTRVAKYATTPYNRGDWMEVEIYIKLSSGGGSNANGICQLKVNGQTVFYGDDIVTGVPGRMASPAIKATCDCPSGKGWWQIDDYEVWDGLPDSQPCSNGQTKPCNTGEPGVCSQGTATCILGTWGNCLRNTGPTQEICGNGIDEDCDGQDLSCPLPGDLNQDGQVNLEDFIQLITRWLRTSNITDEDLNNDNRVDTRDLGIMMSGWGQ